MRFDAFTLDVARGFVLKGNERVALRRQSLDVLRHLAEHPGEVVSAQELIEAVWTTKPARPEDSLVQCIKDIRRALGEDARWIVRTVSGRGYMFMAGVTTVEEALPDPAPQSAELRKIAADPAPEIRPKPGVWPHRGALAIIAAVLLIIVVAGGGWLVWQRTRPAPVVTMMAVPTVAVLPFTPLGDGPDLGEQARSLSNDLAIEITGGSRSWMLSFRSGSGYRGGRADLAAAGRQLGARYLVVGTVRRDGGVVRANVELIEAHSGRQVWVTAFERAADGARGPVPQLASSLTHHLIAAESRRPLPAQPEAAHYDILGRALGNIELDPENNRKALAFYEKSLAIDPDRLSTLVNYAWAQLTLVEAGPVPPEEVPARLDRAEAALARALRLQEKHGAARVYRAKLWRLRGDVEGAIAELNDILAINPNLPAQHAELGRAKMDIGRADETIAHIEKAIRAFPSYGTVHLWQFWAGQAALFTGDDRAALQWLQKAQRRNYAEPVPWLAVALARLGREEEGRALLAQHAAKTPGFTVSDWIARRRPRNAVAAAQFAPIAETMRRLDAADMRVKMGSKPQPLSP
jgi:DNA-binding winged helix-turn-helix (wHTH) protein/TolB-like protein